ncbi:MAG: flagellar export chaperone FlgN [Ignavibacteriaceae bacterium]
MNNLFNELIKQHELLQKFLDLISLQQKAIINNDIKSLEGTLHAESSFFNEIETNQKLMVEIIKQLSEKYALKPKSNKLSDFLNALKVKGDFKLNNFFRLQASIKNLIFSIIKINNQNKLLISQARNFIKEIMSVFTNSNKNAILDRKI